MPLLPALLDGALLTSASIYAGLALRVWRAVRVVRRLPERDSTAPDEPGLVSVVIPARDEAAHIESAILNALAQRGVALEVLVVDDRSQDGTAARAEAAGGGRARVLRIDELPAGWLGKPHACQLGGAAARGDWILFTDADVRLDPDVIARALAAGRAAGAQHVVLLPGVARASFAARIGLATFAGGLVERLGRAQRGERGGWLGIGAFNLVEARAWRAIGGHQRLAFEVVDDMRLGLLLTRAGFATRGWFATREVRVDWGATLGAIPRLLEKNLFAFLGFRTWLAYGTAASLLALWVAGPLGALRGGAAGWAAFLAWLAPGIVAAVGARRAGEPALPMLLVPLGPPLMAWALVRSTRATLRRGGVAWRGTLYPLSELRARRTR
jgi:hypothetical protein